MSTDQEEMDREFWSGKVMLRIELQDQNGQIIERDYSMIPTAELDRFRDQLLGWGRTNYMVRVLELLLEQGLDKFDFDAVRAEVQAARDEIDGVAK